MLESATVYQVSRTFHPLPAQIRAASLDFPAASGSDFVMLERLRFGGWVLPVSEGASVSVLLRAGSIEQRLPLNGVRKDVLRKIAGVADHGDSIASVGFSGAFSLAPEIQVLIEIEGEEYPWATVSLCEGSRSVDEFLAFRRAYAKGTLDADAFSRFSPEDILAGKQVLKQAVRVHHGMAGFLASASFSPEDAARFSGFEQYVRDFKILIDLCCKDGATIRSPLSDAMAGVRAGHARGAVNVVEFFDGEKVFYVIQHVSAVDAIYLPEKDALIVFQHLSADIAPTVVDLIFDAIIPRVLTGKGSAFSGYLVGFPRPYHLLYDMMPAVHRLVREGYLNHDSVVMANPGADFLDVAALYGMRSKKPESSDAGYHLVLGLPFLLGVGDEEKEAGIRSLDETLLAWATRIPPREEQLIAESRPLVWLGVTGQKRSWVEQEEGLAEIIKSVLESHPDAGFVFDGWTAPLTQTELDRREIAADTGVMDRVLANVGKPVRYFSVIGETMEEKIRVGSRVDAFVANYLTGSMVVARVCKKPGIGHISNKAIANGKKQHIHPLTVCVAQEQVVDLDAEKREDFVSYGMDWTILSSMLIDVLSEV